MNKHTTGPWLIGTPPPNGEMTVGTEQGLMVAVATTGLDMPTGANARLIAAAPELLEALQGALNLLEEYEVKIEGEWGICRNIAKIEADGDLPTEITKARAAIAKATRG